MGQKEDLQNLSAGIKMIKSGLKMRKEKCLVLKESIVIIISLQYLKNSRQ